MKIVTFNVNGIRARLHQIERLVDEHAPDVIGIQETKVADEMFPEMELRALGYEVIKYGQPGHYGVAVMTKLPCFDVKYGFDDNGEQGHRRAISCLLESPSGEKFVFFNGYFPQGESRAHPTKFPHKQAFYKSVKDLVGMRLASHKNVIVVGDMNVAPNDLDVGIGAENAKRWLKTGKCCFLPEERGWLEEITALGLEDVCATRTLGVSAPYSWYDYRSKGFEANPKRGLRIDLILASKGVAGSCNNAGIDLGVRAMEKPSDHAPVWAEFQF